MKAASRGLGLYAIGLSGPPSGPGERIDPHERPVWARFPQKRSVYGARPARSSPGPAR